MHTIGQKARDTSWDTPYIHGADEETDETFQADDHDAVYTVHLDRRKLEFAPEDFLKKCWTNGFDTPCALCRKEFDLSTEPPVRLLSLAQHSEPIDPLTDKLPHLIVKNYHLGCLKADNVKFFPVSHPWHSSIAQAYALRTYNAKAAQTCYEIPIRTLLAVARHFGRDHMLWHDYISIPQWQDDFRGTVILPQIFKIFETSGYAIIHLGRLPPVQVVQNPTPKIISGHSEELQQFFKAHLFTRLWPIVETDRAGDAYIMSNEYDIMDLKFSAFVERVKDAVATGRMSETGYETLSSRWLDDLPLFIRERQKTKCLGYVYDMIADLGCRSFRDKFIGASELLGVADYPTQLPTDTQDACLWLAERRIEANDLSPLLLRPSAEPIYEKAFWLKGHQVIQKEMWGWGTQIHPPAELPQLDRHTVRLELHLLGIIVDNISWNIESDGGAVSTSKELLSLVTSSGGSTTEFLNRLECTNPATIFPNRSVSVEASSALTLNVRASKILIKVLGSFLEQYAGLAATATSPELRVIFNKVLSLLALSASDPTPNLDHFESLGFSHLQQHVCSSSERNLVSVSCSDCLKQSKFRAELWQEPGKDAKLFSIPGLTYQYSAEGGIGMITEKGRIIGRTRFCASRCNCNRSVPVKIT